MGALGGGPRHDDRELVAADPERPIAPAQVGRDRRAGVAQDLVPDRVAASVIDQLEVVEIDDRERELLSIPDGARPLALDLLLERPMIAQARQRVAQRFRPRAIVGVLEDPASLLDTFRRFEDAAREPDGQRSQDDRDAGQTERRHDQRRSEPPRQPIDDRRSDRDRDGEHRDEREEQSEPDESQIRRLAEKPIGRQIVVDRRLLRESSRVGHRYTGEWSRADVHRRTGPR